MTAPSLGFHAAAPDSVAGRIRLSVARTGRRTTPVRAESRGALRLMRPLYLDDSGQLMYVVVNPGGAYFGERYHLSLDLGADAHLLVSAQGATRIYRTPDAPAEQLVTCTLGDGSRLEYVPDQTIAYRDADYRQITTVRAAPSAQGFFGEIVTPGWDPEGATFTYAGIHLRFDVVTTPDQRPVCTDNIRIRPQMLGDVINGIGHLEGASHMGSVWILGPHATGAYADDVRSAIESCGIVKAGVTRGERHGVSWLLVRALAGSTDELRGIISAVNKLDRATTTGQSTLDLRRY